MAKIFRQGDVLLREVKQIPSSAQKSEDRILAQGETTGHAHKVSQQLQVFRTPEQTYIQGTGQLLHEEHGAIQIPEGTYEVVRQREYDPIAERQVSD